MGSAAVKMGVITGPPIESPDVMYDLKERVHRTPHVRGSAVPSPTRLNINQEQDLMLLSNGTVVRIQVKHKDGSRGINLYKRNLKSVPRELFYHPHAEEVTWLNLACNALVYNKNGLFKNLDKVEQSYYKEDSDIEEENEDEKLSGDESSKSKASSRRSSVSKTSSAEMDDDGSRSHLSQQNKVDSVSIHSEIIKDEKVTSEAVEASENLEGSPGEQILLENTASEETKVSPLPETVSQEQPMQPGEELIVENESSVDPSEKTEGVAPAGKIEVNQDMPDTEDVEIKDAVSEVTQPAEKIEHPEADPAEQAQVEETAEALPDNLQEVTPVEILEPKADLTEEALEAAPAESGPLPETTETGLDHHGTEQNLTIKPEDLIPEDVISEVSSIDMGQDTVLEPVEDVAEKSTNKDETSVVDEQPTRENDTNIEDFDGSIALRSQAPKSVAESVDISEFEEIDEEVIEETTDAEDSKVAQDTEGKTSTKGEPEEEEEGGSNAAGESKESSSDCEEEESEEEEAEELRELMSDEEGDLHDEEGNVIPRPANTLPNRFHKLPNLVELHLGYYGKGNPLKTIPNSVYSLTLLKKLDASSCRLTEIPPEISQLASLEELWLSGNFLSSLPKSIGDLKKLKSLWVNYNQLNGIPATLEFCESLEGIYAHGNQIEFLSTALCRIPKLKHLGVGRNRIKFLPKNIGELVNLEEAWLNDNHIREVPNSLFDLQALKTLWMSNNQLTSLDKRIGKLAELSELSLSKNRLTTLPASLADCTKLRVLQLDDNKLVALPKSLNNLGHLEELWLNGNAVKEIPEGLYMISNMKRPV